MKKLHAIVVVTVIAITVVLISIVLMNNKKIDNTDGSVTLTVIYDGGTYTKDINTDAFSSKENMYTALSDDINKELTYNSFSAEGINSDNIEMNEYDGAIYYTVHTDGTAVLVIYRSEQKSVTLMLQNE